MIKFVSSILIISSLLLFTACGSSTSGGGSSTTPPTTNQNHAPIIDTTFSDISLLENNGTTSYDINISDIDGDELNLNIESNDTTILTISKNFTNPLQQADYKNTPLDFNLTTIQNASGVVKITITVDDGDKNSTTSFNITVSNIIWKGSAYNAVTSPYAYAYDVNVTINNTIKTYKVGTKRVWLDRNLGASRVCKDLNDSACYGDYYQWGRNTDGHEKSNSNTTSTQAISTLNVGHGKFITSTSAYNEDWVKNADKNGSTRSTAWSKIDGSSICPVGYRVPTKNELGEEIMAYNRVTNSVSAFENFLKLPSAGLRNYSDGSLIYRGLNGFLWSSSFTWNNPSSMVLSFNNSNINFDNGYRAVGFSVRCIKD